MSFCLYATIVLMVHKNKHTLKGFTIVELLIVIVVIAILAAIVIVSYNGISRRAEITALQSDLRNTATKLNLDKTKSGDVYIASLNSEVSVKGDKTELTYTRLTNTTFCLSAASKKTPSLVYNITQEGKINEGYCAGHDPNASTSAGCFDTNYDTGLDAVFINGYYDNENNNTSSPACPRAVVIPSNIGGHPVKYVESIAFENKNLTAVTFPNTLISIGSNSFALNHLTSVVIPDSVTSLGMGAFAQNYTLASVTLSNSLTSIEGYTFMNNSLTSITIPNSVTSIGYQAFQANSLTSVTLPSGITTIATYAFRLNNLTNVNIPNATTIQSNAFDSGVTINRY